jgi:hemerythrin
VSLVPIQWTEDLAVGVPKVDEQHRELYRQVAQLHACMRANRLDEVPHIVEFLQHYALEHFATEEREMHFTSYPGIGAHKALHKAFVDEFLRHKALLSAGLTPSAVVQLSAWLGDWLREHVRGADGELGRYLKARSAGTAKTGP